MDAQELRNLSEAYLEVYQPLDEAMIVKTGTSTNAAGQQIPWTHTHNTATGKSIVKDKFGKRDVSVRSAKMKSKMDENYDIYDIILSHLLDEGYADTEQAAEAIMVNMSEEWRESVVEAYKDLPVDRMIRQAAKKHFRAGMDAGSEITKGTSDPKQQDQRMRYASQTGRMAAQASMHKPQEAQAKSKLKKG